MFVYILLKLVKSQLVPVLKPPVLLGVLLHCIVGQVYSIILAIVEHIVKRGSAQVSFLAEKYFHVLVYDHVHPYIKLPAFDQKRSLYVLLDYKTHILMNLYGSRKLVQVTLKLRLGRNWTEKWLL